MNQFLQEQVVPAQLPQGPVISSLPLKKSEVLVNVPHPKPSKWADRAKQPPTSLTGIGAKSERVFDFQGQQQAGNQYESSKTPGSGPKGKWKQRAQNDFASVEVQANPIFRFDDLPTSNPASKMQQMTPPTKYNIYRPETPGAVLDLRETVQSSTFKAVSPISEGKVKPNIKQAPSPVHEGVNKKDSPVRTNKWDMKKKGILVPQSEQEISKTQVQRLHEVDLPPQGVANKGRIQSPTLMSNGAQALVPYPGGPPPSAAHLLKQAAKSMEAVDPHLAEKAQAFFFEKMGTALLNNFKSNLASCGYCGRKFDSCKHRR